MVYRDLGGIKNKEGKIIKNNFLFRSANLSNISNREIRRLKKYNLYKIIDLRTNEEQSEKPNKIIPSSQYVHIPIFDAKTIGITYEKGIRIKEILKEMPNMEGLYRSMVIDDYSVSQIRQILHEIIESEDYPILFHCTAGKDRTGIITMLLLNILDVEESKIIEDYLLENKKHKLKSFILYVVLIVMTRDRKIATKVRNFFVADEKYLKAAILAINEKYESMDNFIRNVLDVSDNHKEAFKAKVLK